MSTYQADWFLDEQGSFDENAAQGKLSVHEENDEASKDAFLDEDDQEKDQDAMTVGTGEPLFIMNDSFYERQRTCA